MTKQFGRIEDRLAIHDLIYRYAMHIDEREVDQWSDLFAADGVLDETAFGSGRHVGTGQIRDYGRSLVATVVQAVHHMTNIILHDVSDRTASGMVFGLVEARMNNGEHGRYHVIYEDHYAKSGDNWVFTARVLRPALATEIVTSAA